MHPVASMMVPISGILLPWQAACPTSLLLSHLDGKEKKVAKMWNVLSSE